MSRTTTHLWLSLFFTVVSSLGILFFLQTIDPARAQIHHFIVLYGGVFLWIFGTATILGFFSRRMIWWRAMKYEQLVNARRQAVLFSFLGVMFLILQGASLLNIWTSIFLVIVFVLIELYVQ